MMTYSQKKEALKRILSASNQKNKGGIKPIASSLLQALKEKRPTLKPTNHPQKFSQRLKEYPKDPIKVIQFQDPKPEKKSPGISKIFHKPKSTYNLRKEKEQFSPPSNLDSGFTPFFKSSKYFDEDGYFENLTTTETLIETIEETTKPPALYQPQRNFGEKKTMQQKTFITPYYTTLKPNSPKPGRYDFPGKHLTTVPSYDGFLDNWDSLDQDFPKFNSQKQKQNSKSKAKPYFDQWDRRQKNIYKSLDKDHYKPLDVVEERRDQEKQITELTGFMDSQPFSLPLSFQSSFKPESQKANGNLLGRTPIQSERDVRKTYPRDYYNKYERSYGKESDQRRIRIDKPRSEEPQSRTKTFEIEYRGNAENSFGDDFSFSDSNLGEFFDDISDTFPDMSDFGPSWESLKF